ncbi:hypothetical protein Cni_G12794 [Canna indica]|uniref:Uncharacterized protein n=1 Tax=Canna indica TaxID=4628 RepID=A0AAQ3KBC6_9LILI|nr:hypothetical protein Cni_G12794 [Canna indica]
MNLDLQGIIDGSIPIIKRNKISRTHIPGTSAQWVLILRSYRTVEECQNGATNDDCEDKFHGAQLEDRVPLMKNIDEWFVSLLVVTASLGPSFVSRITTSFRQEQEK